MNRYGQMDISFHAFLTSAPDAEEWSASFPGRFISTRGAAWIEAIGQIMGGPCSLIRR
jgi:hypothetical protein